jgi:hypothetical protein
LSKCRKENSGQLNFPLKCGSATYTYTLQSTQYIINAVNNQRIIYQCGTSRYSSNNFYSKYVMIF